MDTDKRIRPDNLPDDIMLSSAEDLNNDGSFMGGGEDSAQEDWEDEKLDQAVAELMASEEPEDAAIDPEYPVAEPARHEEKPLVVMPSAVRDEIEAKPEHQDEPRERREAGALGESPEEIAAQKKKQPAKKPAHYQGNVNKAALIWMIVLTIVLGGVIGIMIYAFILDRIDAERTPEPEPDSSLQENLNAVAGALEVYLTEVNLDNYNTDIVLVNGGGMVSIKGTLRHSVFINTTSDLTLVMNGVTIEPEKGAALVNLSKNSLTIRLDGMNTLLADGGSYAAALYSNGSLIIRGDGQVMIYASGAGSQAIATQNGYQMDGGAVVALGQKEIERPIDDSTQAYFAKDLSQVYKLGTLVSASDEAGEQVVKFTAPGDFSSIFVSNSKLRDGVQYSISLGGNGSR